MALNRARFLCFPVCASVALAIAVGVHARAQGVAPSPARADTAKLVGQVVAADGGAGVKFATVRLTARSASLVAAAQGPTPGPRPGPPGPACQTDEDGYFEFTQIAGDRYILNVESPAYARPMPLQGIDLEAGQTGVVKVALERPGAVSGHVLGDAGGALTGARVRLLRRDLSNGSGRLVIGTMGPGSMATTDLQGAFAFAELTPGDYYLVAGSFPPLGPAPNTGPHVGYVPTYYPGSSLPAGALPITVRAGQETRNADFALRRDKLGAVSGQATDSSGRPFPMGSPGQPARASIMLRSVIDDPALVSNVIRYPDGRFTIPNVAPGDYYLIASVSTAAATAPAESAYVPVAVNGNEVRVDVRTNAGGALSGRVVIEGSQAAGKPGTSAPPVIVSTRQPVASTVPAVHAATTVGDDRAFRLAPLRGRVLLTAQADGLVLKSVVVGGQDVTGRAIDLKGTEQITDAVIVMSADTGRLQGTVTNGDGVPVAANVILFADAPDRFGPQSPAVHVVRAIGVTPAPATERTTSAPSVAGSVGRKLPPPGAFTFSRVLPGRYLLVAVDSGNSMPILDRDSFTRWRSLATEVTLTAGQTTTAHLRTVR